MFSHNEEEVVPIKNDIQISINVEQKAKEDTYSKRLLKKCCSNIFSLLYCPFRACSVWRVFENTFKINIICSIISCIIILLEISSNSNMFIMYTYIIFIIRNLVHNIILSTYKYSFNKLRLFYNFVSNLTLITLLIYNIFTNVTDDININLYIALIAMSCYLIVCDLVMITGITVQPNTIYDKYFDINTDDINLQYVGKHASKIQLDDISLCINEMKIIYKSNITRIISNRKQQLQNLINLIEENEEALLDAVRYDLGRSDMVSSCCDIYPVLGELKQCMNNIHCWSAPQRIPISRATFPSTDYYLIEPLGTIFVHGIWNFPIHLTLLPLAGCIAAGNNVVVKVANEANKTAILLCDLLHKYMDSRFVQCIGHPLIGSNHIITSKILENEFDLIFFTGSTNGGKYIQSQAAKFMTPVILECGGKNPCFIDDTADIQMSARTICNARIINCGQFCIEPDYVLIYENVLNEFLFECKTFMHKNYKFGDELKDDLCVNQGQFINKTQFERVQKMLQRTNGEIICGGGYDEKTLMIEPTIVLLSDIQNVANDEPTIKEETFGPILWIVPIKTNNINDAIDFVNNVQEKSLALYIFSENKRNQNLITHNTSSGGIQINGCLVYGVHHHSLFGGIGKSGMGYYHGFDGFLAFSHRKPIVHSWREMKLFQPPYSDWKRVLFRYAF